MSEKVIWPIPLERVSPFYPGQMGVPGSSARIGLQTTVGGAVFYVDPNYGSSSDDSDGTDPLAPLESVQAAHDKASQGDTIAVMHNNAWQYGNVANGRILPISEEVTITTPGLRIVGINPAGVNGVVWTPKSNSGWCITNLALDTLIEGFLFTSDGVHTTPNAIRSTWILNSAYGDNLTVRNCVFEGAINIAIEMDYSWYVHIYQNRFWSNTYGLYANPAYAHLNSLDVHDNLFYENDKAMNLVGCSYSYFYRNQIYNHDARMGINATDDGIDLMNGLANLVSDNTFSCLLARMNNFCTAGATDSWVNNHAMDGLVVLNPT